MTLFRSVFWRCSLRDGRAACHWGKLAPLISMVEFCDKAS